MDGRRRFVVAVAGGSGSGKTTFTDRVLERSRQAQIPGVKFSLDHYFWPLDHLSLREREAHNFDHPDAIDFELALKQLRGLLAGEPIDQPIYDFAAHTRLPKTHRLEPASLIVVEGLYALYLPEFLALYDYKVFLSTDITTAALRRLTRDIAERGRAAENAAKQIQTTVLPMYKTYVEPTQHNAHVSINWAGTETPEKTTESMVRMIRDFFASPSPASAKL